MPRRAPYGARGLKLIRTNNPRAVARRAPYGARGLKPSTARSFFDGFSRAPYGARGLKQPDIAFGGNRQGPRPGRGAWVET